MLIYINGGPYDWRMNNLAGACVHWASTPPKLWGHGPTSFSIFTTPVLLAVAARNVMPTQIVSFDGDGLDAQMWQGYFPNVATLKMLGSLPLCGSGAPNRYAPTAARIAERKISLNQFAKKTCPG